jgi:hypothetical protein
MKSVMKHEFSRVPQADIPRSNFNRSFGHKTTFDAGLLVPVFVDEALPGDTFNVKPTMFARLATPIRPIMDNLFLDIHWFSVPYRQIWDNFKKFCGEQVDPGDSTDYLIPQFNVGTGVQSGKLEDYFGLPIGIPLSYNALFYRAYCHIYNEWYRDQNLIDSIVFSRGDIAEGAANGIPLRRRGKRHDYFTSCLPWLQKGDAVNIPVGGEANLIANAQPIEWFAPGADPASVFNPRLDTTANGQNIYGANNNYSGPVTLRYADEDEIVKGMVADLSSATAATVNDLRMAFQIQKLLERDARSGTRYSEIVKAHFGVDFLDVTYRPEYLGGGSTPINIHPVASTSASDANIGDLGALGTGLLDRGGFVKSFTEHCIVMGIASVRADLTYQQGIPRMFSRSTRYDHYWPALAHIGEQAVLNKEIFYQNLSTDDDVFGYQERWAEYRYKNSLITGIFRSDASGSLDSWHLSQDLSAPVFLGQSFIEENAPIARVVQTPSEPDFIVDMYFNFQCARPMPVYSVPGLIDHF